MKHIYGLPELGPADKLKVSIGNASMKASAYIINLCCSLGIACTLGNPSGSRLFKAPPFVSRVRTFIVPNKFWTNASSARPTGREQLCGVGMLAVIILIVYVVQCPAVAPVLVCRIKFLKVRIQSPRNCSPLKLQSIQCRLPSTSGTLFWMGMKIVFIPNFVL